MKLYPPFVIEIDANISEVAIRLGQYVNNKEEVWFVESIFSLLLACLVYEDVSYSTDHFESLLSMTDVNNDEAQPQAGATLFGEYLELQSIFFRKYRHDADLINDLTDRISSLQLGGPPVLYDIFSVKWSRTGHYLMVSLGSEYAQNPVY